MELLTLDVIAGDENLGSVDLSIEIEAGRVVRAQLDDQAVDAAVIQVLLDLISGAIPRSPADPG